MLKIAIVTVADDGVAEYAEYTNELKRRYCELHGYRWVLFQKNLAGERHSAWSKWPAMLKVAETGVDWIVWMDADAAPVNASIKLTDLLEGVDADIVIQRDVLGWNTGIFAVRSNDFGVEWLRKMNSADVYEKHRNSIYNEQSAAAESLDFDYMKKHVAEPEFSFNSYDFIYPEYTSGIPNEYKTGDFVLHLPGAPNRYRAWRFRNALDNFDKQVCPICGCASDFCFSADMDRTYGTAAPPTVKKYNRDMNFDICGNCGFVFSVEALQWTENDFLNIIYNDEYYKFINAGLREERLRRLANVCGESLLRLGSRHLDCNREGDPAFSSMLRGNYGLLSDCCNTSFLLSGRILNKYSFVTCADTLSGILNPGRLFEKIHNITTDGAYLLTTARLYDNKNCRDGKTPLSDWQYVSPRSGHLAFYSLKTLQTLAVKYGFRLVESVDDHQLFVRNLVP